MLDSTGTIAAPARGRAVSSTRRSRVTNVPAKHISGNTAQGRRAGDRFAALSEKVGNPTSVLAQAEILRAAKLMALAEELRAPSLHGDAVDSDGLTRLENLASRAASRLKPPPVKPLAMGERFAIRGSP